MNILQILTGQDQGRFLAEANNEIVSLVQACRKTGKIGMASIYIRVKPVRMNEMQVSVAMETRLPKIDPPPKRDVVETTLYSDQEGNLTKENPDQPELFPTSEPPSNESAAQK